MGVSAFGTGSELVLRDKGKDKDKVRAVRSCPVAQQLSLSLSPSLPLPRGVVRCGEGGVTVPAVHQSSLAQPSTKQMPNDALAQCWD